MAMIGELATAHPVEVLPQTPVFEAARAMADMGIGDVIVTDDKTGAVVGMLTDRDITVRVVAKNLDPSYTKCGDVCSTDIKTISATTDVVVAERIMRDEHIRRLPIVNEKDKLVGIVSIMDLAASGYVASDDLREVLSSLRQGRRNSRITD